MALSRLQDVIFSINTGETITDTNQVTDFPVEDRNNIVDNIDPNPRIISFSGIIVGEDAERKLNTLRMYQRNGEILSYTGRNIIPNVVIESLSTIHDNTIRSGFKFEISLKEIQTAEIQTTLIDFSIVPRPVIQQETKQGRKQKTTVTTPQNFDLIQSRINAQLEQLAQ